MSARWTASRAYAFVGNGRVYMTVDRSSAVEGDARPWKWEVAGPHQSCGGAGTGESRTLEEAKRAATKLAKRVIEQLDADKAKINAVVEELS